jgi:hypothetical protein
MALILVSANSPAIEALVRDFCSGLKTAPTMRNERVDGCGAFRLEQASSHTERGSGVNHVVDENSNLESEGKWNHD